MLLLYLYLDTAYHRPNFTLFLPLLFDHMDPRQENNGIYPEPSARSLGKMRQRELDIVVELYLPKGTNVSYPNNLISLRSVLRVNTI